MLTTAILNICTGKNLLIGLRQENKCTNNGECQTALEKDEVSFQFSTHCLGRDDSFTPSPLKRRFSFPAGLSTIRRKLLFDHEATLKNSGRQLEAIPENNDGLPSAERQTHTELLSKRRIKFHRRKFYSESDADYPHQSSRHINMWQTRCLRNRVSVRRRKTFIMLVLSAVFIVTMSLYLGLVCTVANTEGVLKSLTKLQTVQFFFFWRLYFINTLINPILYGFMDQRFRKGLVRLFCSRAFYLQKYSSSVFS
jgi:hypothetical protein